MIGPSTSIIEVIGGLLAVAGFTFSRLNANGSKAPKIIGKNTIEIKVFQEARNKQ